MGRGDTGGDWHRSPVVVKYRSSFNAFSPTRIWALEERCVNEIIISISRLSVSEKFVRRGRSTLGSTMSIMQARGFSLSEILTPPQQLERGLCGGACTCGSVAGIGEVRIMIEPERVVGLHGQNGLVRNVAGLGWVD